MHKGKKAGVLYTIKNGKKQYIPKAHRAKLKKGEGFGSVMKAIRKKLGTSKVGGSMRRMKGSGTMMGGSSLIGGSSMIGGAMRKKRRSKY